MTIYHLPVGQIPQNTLLSNQNHTKLYFTVNYSRLFVQHFKHSSQTFLSKHCPIISSFTLIAATNWLGQLTVTKSESQTPKQSPK